MRYHDLAKRIVRFVTDAQKRPLLSVFNFSGGKQSSCLLWMLLKGDYVPKGRPLVVNADPGMEDERTYRYVADMKRRCDDAGIEFITAPGPNLYEDLINTTKDRRMDPPGYFVTNSEGKTGKLRQCCTQAYKIVPMNRVVREVLERDFGIGKRSSPPENCVELIIGFHAGEWHRCSETGKKFSKFTYPLIEMGMDDSKVAGYFLKHKLPIPPRSVCSGCFANDIHYFRKMYEERPNDWAKAVAVDEHIRNNLKGVDGDVFVLRQRVPLKSLPETEWSNTGVDIPSERDELCNQGGHCFI